MAFAWADHTGEVELRIEAESEEEVFRDALAAYRELVDGERAVGPEEVVELELEAADRAELLARWLEELIFLADARGFVPERTLSLELRPDGLRAAVSGRAGSPAPLVKAVTYHGLDVSFDGSRWHARVVLDV